MDEKRLSEIEEIVKSAEEMSNRELAAAFDEVVPELVAEVRRLKEENAELQEKYSRLMLRSRGF